MDSKTIDAHLRYSLTAVASVGGIALLVYFAWFGLWLGEPFSPDQAKWGTFGDYIGGLLNPLVAACALYWLTMSVRLQKQELAETRAELAKASGAQEEQAKMALLGIQLNALTTRLSSANVQVEEIQRRIDYAVQRMDAYTGIGTPMVYDVDTQKRVKAPDLIDRLEQRLIYLYGEQRRLMDDLDEITRLAMSKQTQSAAQTPTVT